METPGSDSLCDDTDPGGNECRRLVDGDQKAPKGSHFDNINVIGQGLKHLFQHQRRRSSVSPHDVQQAQPEPELDPDQAQESDGSAQPTALNRVLQQIRVPPKVKRGSSLQQNRKTKTRGSPQIGRRSAQDIMAVLSHPGRPRSSSTTDAHTASAALEMSSASYLSGEGSAEKLDRLEGGGLSQASSMVSSGAEGMLGADTVDGTPDPQRTKAAILQLQQKILKLTEQIKIEQTARDDNVAEYLKLANNADRQQGVRIKQVFEKKNQKSSQNILQLQKKLEHYHRKLREVEQNGIARQPKDVLRDMHQGLKDVGARVSGFSEGVVDSVRGGLSSFSQATHSAAGAVVSKPREIASLLRNRFGSSDNISSLDDPTGLTQGEEGAPHGKSLAPINMFQASPKYGSEEDCSSATSGSLGANSTSGGPGGGGGGSSRTNTLDMQGLMGFEMVIQEIQEMRETQNQLEESLEGLRTQYQSDYSFILQSLQEERYRCERLEEQLNDLTELHQNEILNLKQELASMEEKIAYQSYERARDIQEALEACQTRISKMELQQQQQQVVQLEGLENATARNLLGKLINILLALMAVVLVFVSTVANCVVPLLKTRGRTLGTVLLVLLAAILYKHSDSFSGYLERLLSPPR
ncbi:transmembrane and coiled-coil domains protein 1 isoform 1-T1 [Leptodactylus fuscus]|uniref:transmembrane and coiled-coil domains protein 1 isoform X1 n=1 Tax=Leptodactylus fuscus TaxID=238119 RepID=UPI003F4F3C5F